MRPPDRRTDVARRSSAVPPPSRRTSAGPAVRSASGRPRSTVTENGAPGRRRTPPRPRSPPSRAGARPERFPTCAGRTRRHPIPAVRRPAVGLPPSAPGASRTLSPPVARLWSLDHDRRLVSGRRPPRRRPRRARAGGVERGARPLRAVAAADDGPTAWEGLGWAAWWQRRRAGDVRGARARLPRLPPGRRRPRRRAAGGVAGLRPPRLPRRRRRRPPAGCERAATRCATGRRRAEHGWLALMEADIALRRARRRGEASGAPATRAPSAASSAVADLEARRARASRGIALVGRGDGRRGHAPARRGARRWRSARTSSAVAPGLGAVPHRLRLRGRRRLPRAPAQWCRAMRAWSSAGAGATSSASAAPPTATCSPRAATGARPRRSSSARSSDLRSSRARRWPRRRPCRLGELRAPPGRSRRGARAVRGGAAAARRRSSALGELALRRRRRRRPAADAAERVLRRAGETSVLDRLPGARAAARAPARPRATSTAAARPPTSSSARRRGSARRYMRGRAPASSRAEVAAAGGDHDGARRAAEDAVDLLRRLLGALRGGARAARARAGAAALGRAGARAAEARPRRATFSPGACARGGRTPAHGRGVAPAREASSARARSRSCGSSPQGLSDARDRRAAVPQPAHRAPPRREHARRSSAAVARRRGRRTRPATACSDRPLAGSGHRRGMAGDGRSRAVAGAATLSRP